MTRYSWPGNNWTQFLQEWATFPTDVLSTYRDLDLSALVSTTDDQDGREHFTIECKLGLSMRFVKHVCKAVSKAMSVVPDLSRLSLGAYSV